jgi:hypothetical protein
MLQRPLTGQKAFYSCLHIKVPTCFGEICLNLPGWTQFCDSLSQSSWKEIDSEVLGTNSHVIWSGQRISPKHVGSLICKQLYCSIRVFRVDILVVIQIPFHGVIQIVNLGVRNMRNAKRPWIVETPSKALHRMNHDSKIKWLYMKNTNATSWLYCEVSAQRYKLWTSSLSISPIFE